MKKKLVVSTGAGMSAESGISTFRDAGGLWEQYPVMEVCSTEGWERNPALIHKFYNERRKQLIDAKPNQGHLDLVKFEPYYDMNIITQNVDNLHERAGSRNVLHLHGELMKVRSLTHPERLYTLDSNTCETSLSTRDPYGDPVRPHIVFFGESVPNFEKATEIVGQADIFVVIGTSLAVYPAASLLNYTKRGTEIYYIDPNPARVPSNINVISETATTGIRILAEKLGITI